MDYEKKYKQALERATRLAFTGNISAIAAGEIFPELKESEDERIKKEIIDFIQEREIVCSNGDSFLPYKKWIAWLEKQKTTEEALQYLKENHSPSEVSDYQAAMNIAVAKAYNKGYTDGFEKQGEQKSWSEEDEKMLNSIIEEIRPFGECPDYPTDEDREYYYGRTKMIDWLKSLKPNHWKPSKEQMKEALQTEYEKGRFDSMQDFMEKAEKFFNDMYDTMGKPVLGKKTIELFKNYMQNEM